MILLSMGMKLMSKKEFAFIFKKIDSKDEIDNCILGYGISFSQIRVQPHFTGIVIISYSFLRKISGCRRSLISDFYRKHFMNTIFINVFITTLLLHNVYSLTLI